MQGGEAVIIQEHMIMAKSRIMPCHLVKMQGTKALTVVIDKTSFYFSVH